LPAARRSSKFALHISIIATDILKREVGIVGFAEAVDPVSDAMCNLYYADLWIMPTIGSERAMAAAIAALESA
jgi:hypothetical protein